MVKVQVPLTRHLALAMVLVFLFSLVAVPLHVVSAQEDEGLRVKADMLIKIANKSRERVEAVFETVATIPDEAKSEYEAGVSALGEAERLRDDGEYQQASEKAVEAMRHFKEAFVIINKVSPEKPEKAEVEAEKAMGLKVAISRAEAFKEKIEALADRAEEQGYDVSEVRTKLIEAETRLEAASKALEGGDVDLSARELAKARGLIGEAMGELHKITVKLSSERAEKFVERAEQKLSIVRKKIIEIADRLPPQARVAVLKALEEAESSLQKAKSHIKAGRISLAVSDLAKHKAGEGKIFKVLKEEQGEAADILEEIAEIRTETRSLNRKIRVLEVMGADVSRVNDILNEVTGLVSVASTRFEEGNLEDAKAAIDKAERLVEDAEEILEQVREETFPKVKERMGEVSSKLEERISKVQKKLEKLKARGLTTAHAHVPSKASEYLKKAEKFAEEGNPKAAKRMLDETERLLETAEEALEASEERIAEVREMLTETKELFSDVEGKVERLRGMGVDVSAIEELLARAGELIDSAEAAYSSEVYSEAEENLRSAIILLKEAEGEAEIIEESEELGERAKIEERLAEVREELNELEVEIEELKRKGIDVSGVEETMVRAMEYVSVAEEAYNVQEYSIAEENLESAAALLERAEEEVEVLEEAEELREEVQALREKAAALSSRAEEVEGAVGSVVKTAVERAGVFLEIAERHVKRAQPRKPNQA
ncbi:TPA: hypothetical protein EYP27_04610 [Candidatus Bathyarchaeota archaeon]|nr:hypothetical protein [Candidatus Bathyarchaeota archaeon]